MSELYCKTNLVLLLLFIIQYLCIFMIYNGNNDYNNMPPIFIIIISLCYLIYKSSCKDESYDYKIIIINIIYISILVFILKKHSNTSKQEFKNEIEEGFTNKLKEFKNKKESFNTTTNLNSSRLKIMKKNKSLKQQKENFGYDDDHKDSLESYKNDFKSYRFTRKVKSSMDALNKLPFYIEKFKELW